MSQEDQPQLPSRKELKEERQLEELLYQQNRDNFLFEVIGNGLHPELAAQKCSLPLEVVEHWRRTDPAIDACWVGVENRRKVAVERYKDHRKATSPEELMANQIKLAHRMMYEAGFEETFLKFVRTLDVDTEDGRKEFINFMRSGPFRDLFMRLGAAKIQMVENERPMVERSESELEAVVEELQKELKQLEDIAASNQAMDVEFEESGSTGDEEEAS